MGNAAASLTSEYHLVSAAMALNAAHIATWSTAERSLSKGVARFSELATSTLVGQIQRGKDPLGEAFSRLRSPDQRREDGATYTPLAIVKAMVKWAVAHNTPARIVDPGVGSARFLLEAGRRFPAAELIGIDIDPLAALTARANLAAAGYADRSEIICGDFRATALPGIDGRTLYIGNPPYVRHHLLGAKWKDWLTKEAQRLGHPASQLAGLHVHFFLATAMNAKPGDFGSFITAAEWLDVNYGQLVRDLFLDNLGGRSITVVEPTARPFADAANHDGRTGRQGNRPERYPLHHARRRLRDRLREAQGPWLPASLAIGPRRARGEGEEGQQDEIHMPGVRPERMGQAGHAANLRRLLRGRRRRNLPDAGRAERRGRVTPPPIHGKTLR